MKIHGEKLEYQDITDVVVIPKGDDNIVFTIKAVFSEEYVNKLVPDPEPPKIQRKGMKRFEPNLEDDDYIAAVRQKGEYRVSWRILESLSATEGLTWDTIDMEKPETWTNWEGELIEAGFTQLEIDFLVTAIVRICGMSVMAMESARANFLALTPE